LTFFCERIYKKYIQKVIDYHDRKKRVFKTPFDNAIYDILKGIDRDVERGEDALMLVLRGHSVFTFAPVAPPIVLLL